MKPGGFKRGFDRGMRKHELKTRNMLTRQQLGITEGLIRAGLAARKGGSERPADKDMARMMRDWLIIHEELGGE